MANVLLAGEQYTIAESEVKGFDHLCVGAYKEDSTLVNALRGGGHQVQWMRTFQVQSELPEKLEELKSYDVILLSDVGANSILFHPQVLTESVRRPNRLKLLRDYAAGGGGLAMIGGWMSFAGIDGKARYHHTCVEEALPVTCQPYDDREEKPEGVIPTIVDESHPILKGVPREWPFFLGYNKVTPRKEATTLLKVDEDPLLCIWDFGDGRAAAFTSDCAPHWGPKEFLGWKGYGTFWNNLVSWLARTLG